MDFIRKIRLRQGEKVSLKIQSAVTLETKNNIYKLAPYCYLSAILFPESLTDSFFSDEVVVNEYKDNDGLMLGRGSASSGHQ